MSFQHIIQSYNLAKIKKSNPKSIWSKNQLQQKITNNTNKLELIYAYVFQKLDLRRIQQQHILEIFLDCIALSL